MDSSFVLRRIDDLGRIVIPKEIRNSFRIRSGENLIISTSGDSIVLKKYNQIDKFKEFADILVSKASKLLNKKIYITNLDYFVSGSDDYVYKKISSFLLEVIENRSEVCSSGNVSFVLGEYNDLYYGVVPISICGDVIGSVIITSNSIISDSDMNIIRLISLFIGNYVE